MFDELQTWWQSTTPEMQAALQEGSVVIAALLIGYFLGAMVARILAARRFDAALRLPGSSPPDPPHPTLSPPRGRGHGEGDAEAKHGITPTAIAGFLVCLSVWAVAAWWVARNHGQVELASTLGLIIARTWGLAALLVAFLTLGSLLARRLVDCLHGLPPEESVASPARSAPAVIHRGIAGAVGAGAYVLVLLLVLLVAADSFDWPLTRSASLALWQFAQQLLAAVAALFIAHLGARWARDMVTLEGAASPEKRVGQYTAAAIVAATTVLAVAVLLFGAGVLMGVAALVVLGFLLWSVRGHLPDVTAGLQLRAHKVVEVRLDGAPWQVAEIGLLTTVLGRAGDFCRLQNRAVLEASLHGTPS
jgi:hypothetical protein